MSVSFTMLVGLYVSAYKDSSPCTDFHGIFIMGSLLIFIAVPVFDVFLTVHHELTIY